MKSYRTLRPMVIGDTRHDRGVVIELIEKQAAVLLAAGQIEPVEGHDDQGKAPVKARASKGVTHDQD